MTPVFEGRCRATMANLKEAMRTSWSGAALVYFTVVPALFLATGIFWLLAYPRKPFAGILAIAGAAVLIALFFLRGHRTCTLQYKRLLMTSGGQVPENILRFYADHVELQNPVSGNRSAYSYGDILGCRETAHLYVLQLRNRMVLPIEKAAFTLGAPEQFPPFLRQAIPGIKLK